MKKKGRQTTQEKEEIDTGIGIGGRYISDLFHAEMYNYLTFVNFYLITLA